MFNSENVSSKSFGEETTLFCFSVPENPVSFFVKVNGQL